MAFMSQIRVREAATFLGVSDDTVRRWIEKGTLKATADGSGRTGPRRGPKWREWPASSP